MAKGKFSLADFLNVTTQPHTGTSEETAANEDFRIELISVHRLDPSEDNFYSVADVADLKDSIELMGVQQNLTVKPIPGTDRYKVIAGHRRRLASLKLVEEGKTRFELVPCRIETSLDEIRERILLIYTNSTTRQLSDYEKVEQLTQLKVLLKEYKKNHELPGRIRELLAEALNVSESQVGRIESISDNLAPEFKEELKHERINFSTAAELSRLSISDQQAAYQHHKEKGSTSLKDVKAQKSEQKETQPQKVDNPTIRALLMVKELLEKEIAKVNKSGSAHYVSEYIRILQQKLDEVEAELLSFKRENIFK